MKELEDAGCSAKMFNSLQNIGGSEIEDTFQDMQLNTETEPESIDVCLATISPKKYRKFNKRTVLRVTTGASFMEKLKKASSKKKK